MRWHEIVEGDMTDVARSAILDFLAPLRSQGVSKVTVDQVLDAIRLNPEIEGMDIDAEFVMNAANSVDSISKIQPDPEMDGIMTLYLDTPMGDRQVSPEQADKEKKDINKAAMRSLDKKQKP